MLKKILSTIVSALKMMVRFAGRTAAFPLRFLGNLVGGSGAVEDLAVPPPIEEYDGAVDAPSPSSGPDLVANGERIAALVQAWAANSVIDDAPAPLPAKLPRGVAAWLPGLTRDEVFALMSASKQQVALHIRSQELVPGVRSVRNLDPTVWPPEDEAWEPAPDDGSPSFAAIALGCG